MQLDYPTGIVRDSSSNTLYIADSYNHRIVSYPSGNIVAGGTSGFGNNQLNRPFGLFYDSFSKSLIISNYISHNVVQWPLDASNWTHMAGGINGSSGNTSTLLFYPVGVVVDPMGNLYVADGNNYRIQFFSQGQKEGQTIAGVTGISSSTAPCLRSPRFLALDNQLNLYVSEINSNRILKFLRY